ncbi:MAG: organic hydroperoxide resistance protein [Aeromicrobium sp.]|jgi:osmotically inducible protein OsmC|uniref:organic hydroperoxide resistance protein n=1 Tax=Aeromicrobium sp. TaxID=1871063 RepID=UPI0026241389|nr:organic hydroperoxide resistance protein [Aeromicrobium sp.]MCW2789205.1 organic hydroperoxide resistance protein [Aeromicrobium sp.]MCW2826028.1 organic hydroperoxide resistance protein [Aeromicrobium sp.]
MPSQILYTAVATSDGDGRNGHVRSDDGLIDADVRTPKEMGGEGGATNPEQLFAAGYAACFHSALKATSKQHGVTITDSAVTAEVGIGPNDAGGFGLAITLNVELGGGVSQEDAEKAVAVAHQVCPYSNATRGNIDVKLEVEVA